MLKKFDINVKNEVIKCVVGFKRSYDLFRKL